MGERVSSVTASLLTLEEEMDQVVTTAAVWKPPSPQLLTEPCAAATVEGTSVHQLALRTVLNADVEVALSNRGGGGGRRQQQKHQQHHAQHQQAPRGHLSGANHSEEIKYIVSQVRSGQNVVANK